MPTKLWAENYVFRSRKGSGEGNPHATRGRDRGASHHSGFTRSASEVVRHRATDVQSCRRFSEEPSPK